MGDLPSSLTTIKLGSLTTNKRADTKYACTDQLGKPTSAGFHQYTVHKAQVSILLGIASPATYTLTHHMNQCMEVLVHRKKRTNTTSTKSRSSCYKASEAKKKENHN